MNQGLTQPLLASPSTAWRWMRGELSEALAGVGRDIDRAEVERELPDHHPQQE